MYFFLFLLKLRCFASIQILLLFASLIIWLPTVSYYLNSTVKCTFSVCHLLMLTVYRSLSWKIEYVLLLFTTKKKWCGMQNCGIRHRVQTYVKQINIYIKMYLISYSTKFTYIYNLYICLCLYVCTWDSRPFYLILLEIRHQPRDSLM